MNNLIFETADEERIARLSVLVWHPKDGKARNLFTHIRHRRHDGMGPWADEPSRVWRTITFPSNKTVGRGEIQLHRLDAPLAHCLDLVKDTLDGNVMTIDDLDVCYDLAQPPRSHWAYRNLVGTDDHSVDSPFSRHSAKVTEFWSFAPEPRDHWRRICDSYAPLQLEGHLRGLGFPLGQRLDRVGNLMISGAQDDIDCELLGGRTHLILKVNTPDGTDLPENAYYAIVWAGDSDDDLVFRHMEITKRQNIVSVDSELDQIGFAIYRQWDGQCIDRWETALIREIIGEMNLSTGQTLEIHDTRRGTANTVALGDAKSVIRVGDEQPDTLDSGIRREILGRRAWQRDRKARAQGILGHFEPDQTEEAIDFFLNLLGDVWRSEGPIYLAEPYFMQRDYEQTNERIYSSMFGRTKGRELRILSGQRDPEMWLSRYPSILTGHVVVRSFTRKNEKGVDKPAFHDRYLSTPDKEIIITHSINGWHDDGATFAVLPYGVYRAHAEELWSLNIGDNNGVHVQEIN